MINFTVGPVQSSAEVRKIGADYPVGGSIERICHETVEAHLLEME